MYIIDCKGTDGENYCFKAHKIPTKEEFTEFLKTNYPDRIGEREITDDGDNFYTEYNDIEIEAIYEYDNLEEIN